MKQKNILIVIMGVIICVLAALIVWLLFFKGSSDVIVKRETDEIIEKNEASISIPGYEGLTLKAGTRKQNVALKNPAQNTCLFVITLALEDGTVLWQSDEIKPGEQTQVIVLNENLDAGEYSATLTYRCYTNDRNKSELNGAETKLVLHVQ